MKCHPRVISYLQRAINHEFSATQQYTLQAVQADLLGLSKFAAELRLGVQEEIRHAEEFIGRMMRLGATPHGGQPYSPPIGRSYAEMLRFGLATEAEAIRLHREAAHFCEHSGDAENHALFVRIHDDEVHHYHDLERALQALGDRSTA